MSGNEPPRDAAPIGSQGRSPPAFSYDPEWQEVFDIAAEQDRRRAYDIDGPDRGSSSRFRDNWTLLSLPGFLFGPLYYFYLGMWRKGVLLLALIPIVGLCQYMFHMTNAFASVIPLLCMLQAKRDYYRFCVKGESVWPFLSFTKNVYTDVALVAIVTVACAAIVLKTDERSNPVDPAFATSNRLAKAEQIEADEGCGAALDAYRSVIEAEHSAAAYLRRGACFMRLDKFDESLADFQDIIKTIPEGDTSRNKSLAAVHFDVALDYLLKEQVDEALQEWTQSARLDPADPDPHTRRAQTFAELAKYDEALTAYDLALKAGADAPQTRKSKGMMLRAKGDYVAALAEYDALKNAGPESDASAYRLAEAEVFLLQGDVPKAQRTVADVLKDRPQDAYGFYLRGLIDMFGSAQPTTAAEDLAASFQRAKEFRMQSILLNEGASVLTGEKADQTSYFSPSRSFLPLAYQVVAYLYIARERAGSDGSDELAKNLDSIAFELRPRGALFGSSKVGWPGQINQFLLNKITIEDLMKTAKGDSGSFWGRSSRVCAVNLFAGLHYRSKRMEADSLRALTAAAEGCTPGTLESLFAKREL